MKLERWAFVSRHVPTPEQIVTAIQAGIELIPAGDRDAFGPDPFEKSGMPDVVGVVCVNPALALQAFFAGYAVGVFESSIGMYYLKSKKLDVQYKEDYNKMF